MKQHLLRTFLLAGLVLLAGCGKAPSADQPPVAAAAAAPAVEPTAAAAPPKAVLVSQLAGSWYTADPVQLGREIDGYLAGVEQEPLDRVMALILPHAGYRYSGPVAAHGIKQLAGKRYRRVVVMGPTHHLPLENLASLPQATHYATPLGEVPLDLAFISALLEHPWFRRVPGAHEREHSVQIEVPLLQRALGEFQLVPIVVGRLDLATARRMAGVLRALVDDETLVVASTDFTHYGPRFAYMPFRDDVEANLRKLDLGAWERIERRDVDGFDEYCRDTGATICGKSPVAVLLAMLPEQAGVRLLEYDTSGRITGDWSNSVSYLCAAVTGSWGQAPARAPVKAAPALGEDDQARLLKLARGTLTHYLEQQELPTPEELGVEISPAMEAVMGVFVTLTKDGSLRGCIGEIFPQRPLYRAVMAQAVNAGVNDRRFRPVSLAELPELSFEISALTPPHPVGSYREIEIGRHGMVLEKHGRSAVYLPQVAPEQGWDLDETLSHLSQKAGLAPDAWREGASFTVFEAIVFGEHDH